MIDVGAEGRGTCLVFSDDVGAQVTELPTVPCGEQHTHEIYAVVTSAQDAYPGFEALEAEAQQLCLDEFEPYVGVGPFDSSLFYSWLVPTLSTWEDEGDREIICVIGNDNGAPLTGSVEGSAR